jgi:hypothetical protein
VFLVSFFLLLFPFFIIIFFFLFFISSQELVSPVFSRKFPRFEIRNLSELRKGISEVIRVFDTKNQGNIGLDLISIVNEPISADPGKICVCV